MCRITVSNHERLYSDSDIFLAACLCWRLFRVEIDGSSDTICECRAMDELYLPGYNLYRSILDGFVRSLERITDSRNNITSGRSAVIRLGREAREEAAIKANIAYSRSFLDLYRVRIGNSTAEQYEKTIGLRVDKFDIATTNHRFRYTLSTTAIMLAISLSALIIASFR